MHRLREGIHALNGGEDVNSPLDRHCLFCPIRFTLLNTMRFPCVLTCTTVISASSCWFSSGAMSG